jgi:hypothetical protein
VPRTVVQEAAAVPAVATVLGIISVPVTIVLCEPLTANMVVKMVFEIVSGVLVTGAG